MPTPDYPKDKPLGILPDGKKHVFGSGLFGGETVFEGGKKVTTGSFDALKRESQKEAPYEFKSYRQMRKEDEGKPKAKFGED